MTTTMWINFFRVVDNFDAEYSFNVNTPVLGVANFLLTLW
jgi:hypothetical protein